MEGFTGIELKNLSKWTSQEWQDRLLDSLETAAKSRGDKAGQVKSVVINLWPRM